MKYLGGLLIVAFCIQSCAHSTVTKITDSAYRPIAPEEVTIFVEFEDLPVGHEKVAFININYTTAYKNKKWAKAKERAAKLGCNGIYERYDQLVDDSNSTAEIVAIRY